MKKVLVVLLSLAMVLGCFSFVGAASFTDVAATDANLDAIEVLAGLGVLEGDGDGTFRPEDGLKRVEACVIIDKMLGYGELGSVKAATSFSDVPASYWGSGYVAVAANLGLISGYGDGTFGPEDKLTYDQWLTILVNALGYTSDTLAGKWPQNYEVKALNLGLVSTSQVGSAAATRSNVAASAFKTLTSTKRVEYDAKGNKTDIATSLLTSVFAAYPVTSVVTYENSYKGTDGDGSLLADYVGQYGKAYCIKKVIDDTKVKKPVVVSFSPDSEIVSYTGTLASGKLTLADKTVYTVVADEDTYYGYNGAAASTPTDVAGANVTVYGKLSGKTLTAVSMLQWKADDASFQVTAANVKTIAAAIAKVEKANAKVTKESDKVDTIVFEGKTYKISDAQEFVKDDVVTTYTTKAGKVAKVEVSTATVTGKVTSVKSGKYTINGVAYSCEGTFVPAVDGTENTYYLTAAGKLFAKAAAASVTASNYAVVTTDAKAVVTDNGYATSSTTKYYVELFTVDGTKAVYTINKTYAAELGITASDAKGFVANAVVKFNLNSDGEINALEVATPVAASGAWNKTTGVFGGKLLASNVAVIKYTSTATTKYTVSSTAAIPAALSAKVTYLTNADGAVAFVLLSDVVAEEKVASYGLLTSTSSETVYNDTTKAYEYKYAAIVDGVETSLVAKAPLTADYEVGALYELTVTDGYLSTKTDIAGGVDYTVEADATASYVKVDGKYVDLNSVKVYAKTTDTTSGTAVVTYSYGDYTLIEKDDVVTLWDTNSKVSGYELAYVVKVVEAE